MSVRDGTDSLLERILRHLDLGPSEGEVREVGHVPFRNAPSPPIARAASSKPHWNDATCAGLLVHEP